MHADMIPAPRSKDVSLRKCRCIDLVHFTLASTAKGLLDRILRGKIRSLKSLSIWADTWKYIIHLSYDKNFITFSILRIMRKLEKLQRLEVFVRSIVVLKEHQKGQLWCMQGNHLTHLDLSKLDEEAFRTWEVMIIGYHQGSSYPHREWRGREARAEEKGGF